MDMWAGCGSSQSDLILVLEACSKQLSESVCDHKFGMCLGVGLARTFRKDHRLLEQMVASFQYRNVVWQNQPLECKA